MGKILIIINNLNLGGAEKVAVMQANGLHKNGFDVSILCLNKSTQPNFLSLVNKDIKVSELGDVGLNLRSLVRLAFFIRKSGHHTVITHLFLSNSLTKIAKILWLSDFSLITFEHNVNLGSWKSVVINKITSRASNRIVAVSESVERALIDSGFNKGKIVVIENGIEPLSRRCVEKAYLGIEDKHSVVVSVGNVSYQKGYDLIIEVAEKLKQIEKPIRFVICGNDTSEYAQELKALVEKKNLQDYVRFLGVRKDIEDILNAADIFLMPSRWEGLSIALLEAMSLSKLVIVSDIDSNRRVINGGNGFLFQTENTEDLFTIINKLVSGGDFSGYKHKALESFQKYSGKDQITKLVNLIKIGTSNSFNLWDQSSDKWLRRVEEAVELIPETDAHIRIADFGCGDKKLESVLRKRGYKFSYVGFDLIQQGEDVRRVDFNEDVIDERFDIVFSIGLIQYIQDPTKFLKGISDNANCMVLSSVIADTKTYKRGDIERLGWKFLPFKEELDNLIVGAGFSVVSSKIIDNGVTYIVFARRSQ